MENSQKAQAVLAVAAVAGILYWAKSLLPTGAMQPRYQEQGADIAGVYSDITTPHGGTVFVPGGQFDNKTVVLPVRYPVRAGHEISCLIEQGYSALWRPRPQNYDWLQNPPSEALS